MQAGLAPKAACFGARYALCSVLGFRFVAQYAHPMIAPVVLLLLSLVGVGVAFIPDYSGLILLAGPCALASLYLLLTAPRSGYQDRRDIPLRWVVVDGSNVMHWNGGTPKLETVLELNAYLREHGYMPGVVFDANVGYKVQGKFLNDRALAGLLGLPKDRVMVVPKGSPADPLILTAARDLGAQIVTNDRFRDWVNLYPEVDRAGHLMRGGYRSGKLWLDLAAPASQGG